MTLFLVPSRASTLLRMYSLLNSHRDVFSSWQSQVINAAQTVKEEWQLTPQGDSCHCNAMIIVSLTWYAVGQDTVKNGSPEARLLALIPAEGIAQAALNVR
jgi:hypothetical protein